MSDAHYLGETIEWKFANEDEWRSYTRTRPFPVVSPGPLIVTLALTGIWFAFQNQAWILWSLVLALIAHILHVGVVFLWQKYNNRKFGLRSVSVRFHPGWIKVTEHYGEPEMLRDVVAQYHRVKRIELVQWVAGGCKLVTKRQFLVRNSFVLPIAMFQSRDDIAALYAWAEHHGITIEGPAPIPGAYLRPVE
jgi:hypothetical protein